MKTKLKDDLRRDLTTDDLEALWLHLESFHPRRRSLHTETSQPITLDDQPDDRIRSLSAREISAKKIAIDSEPDYISAIEKSDRAARSRGAAEEDDNLF